MDAPAEVLYVAAETAAGSEPDGAGGTDASLESAFGSVRRVSVVDPLPDHVVDGDPPSCLVVDVTDGDWLDAFEAARGADPALPVVLVGPASARDAACRAAAVAEGVRLATQDDLVEAVEQAIAAGRDARQRRRASTRLAAFFEHNPDPTVEYVFVDGEPVVRSVNRAFVETFGYGREQVRGERMNDVIVPPEKADEAAAIDERVAAGDDVTAELRRETTDGLRAFLFENIPVDADRDGPDGYAIYVDVDDQQVRERRLEEQNERLNDFASVVTHDLRAPMSAMKNHLDVAELTGDEEHLDRARDALDRMDELVRELLQMARQGDDLGRTETVSLGDTAETAWTHVATGDASLALRDDPLVEADAGRLTQLLENLYVNAVEHNADEAAVTITVGATGDGDGFFVADDGGGIPPAERDQMFESGYTSGDDGTGYGLTIVRQVARAHGWDVAVTESSDGGARFEFRDVAFVDA